MVSGLKEQLIRCNKCGACTAVCPLYECTAREGMAARGKIALLEALLEGELGVSGRLRARLEDCLLCGACAQSCPSLVPTTDLFLEARADLAKKLGHAPWARLLLRALASPVLMGAGAAALGLVQRARVDRALGSLVPLPMVKAALAAAPRVPAVPYRRRHLPAQNGAEASVRIAYFAGCFMNRVYADVAEATHRVLVRNGYRVESPPVACCGMPHRALGDLDAARRLARRNVDLLEGYDAVVTDCATCGAALKAYGQILSGDREYEGRARELARRVYDVCEFLVERGYQEPRAEVRVRVTYHDPCHLGREQRVREQPRQILKSIPGLELVEMRDADACCGGGGSFALTHRELAGEVGRRKAAAIVATGAEAVASGCPSCLSQLRAVLRAGSGEAKAVCHPIELLALSYGLRTGGNRGTPYVRWGGRGV